jgi:uncharacterized LabA/DUF88 family protein
VQVHLAADGDDGVGVGVLVYADLEVRADPLLSLVRVPKGLRILTQLPHRVNRLFRAGGGYFSATIRAMEGRDQSSRVAVFVDGANLYHAIKSYYRGVLDYSRLLEAAVADRKLLRATFYIVEKQETDDAQNTPSARSFVYNLNKFGYKVRSKPLQVHETITPEGERTVSHKGDWDVGIVVDMMRLAAHANAYVLVSGDGDYVEAVEYLQSEKGLRVEAISAAQCTSQALLDVCDQHTDLANIPELFREKASGHRLQPSG